MSTTQNLRRLPYDPKLDLSAWNPPPCSTDGAYEPEETFIRYTEELQMRGGPEWPPSIISFHGHPIPAPNVEIEYVGRGKTFLKCLVTFKKRTLDPEIGLLVESYHFTVPAWQGNNNILHLMEELPGEDEKELDMAQFYETAEEVDTDYLNRIRRFYSDDELVEMAPEVFYFADKASK